MYENLNGRRTWGQLDAALLDAETERDHARTILAAALGIDPAGRSVVDLARQAAQTIETMGSAIGALVRS